MFGCESNNNEPQWFKVKTAWDTKVKKKKKVTNQHRLSWLVLGELMQQLTGTQVERSVSGMNNQ